ncbi:MAG: carboxypeptidase regulatory-like domain-containing protein [Chloroflexi bacterium]|nr:carboxypeptidase regulatory-like domain-containing protein [Chloroflexota bacterium]
MAPLALSDYPRPPEDNGRGVHWSASVYHPSGSDLQYWIDELKAMQIKWVKVLDDSGGSSLELCQTLLANGIMPIVRMYRERPNPGRISGREMDAIRRLIDAGVRYFETNNEPDLPAEWQNNHKPPNWLEIVVDNFIFDADFILDAGGYPALPAMGPGSKDNAIALVVEKGRKDIFERGAWVAIHNYTLNHPLDYPDDPVNQEGRPLTQEEYDYYKRWQYSHLTPEEAEKHGVSRSDYIKFQNWAWDGRTLEEINRLREEKKNPGQTIFDDANCFRAYEFFGNLIFDTLGFYVPVMSTEGGPVVGWGDDKRYPKVNPTTQAEWQLEICRFMQDEAPEWYFTCCTWLLASRPLGDWNPTWDQMSWYTHVWDLQFGLDGQLPIVQLLKDAPANIRHELRPVGGSAAVTGRVTDKADEPLAGVSLQLRQEDRVVVEGQTNADGRYRLETQPGQYDLFAPWVGFVARSITLTEDDEDVIDVHDFDAPGQYRIEGVVRDTDGDPLSGLEIRLRRNGIVHATATSNEAGAFQFEPGVAGTYAVDAGAASTTAEVNPEQPTISIEITLPSVGEMRYVLTEKRLLPPEETENRRIFYGRVRDAEGNGLKSVELEMRWVGAEPGTRFPRTRTGQNPFIPDPDGYYEFLHSPGEFMIEVVQGDFPSDVAEGLLTVDVPGREGDAITYEVNFQLRNTATPAPAESLVLGSIPGGRVGQMLELWGPDGKREWTLDVNREFRFENLSAGVYNLYLAGIGLIAADIQLTGQNQVEIHFPLLGAIVGEVKNFDPAAPGVTLISETHGFTRRAELTQDGLYRFTNLPRGVYRIEVGDVLLPDIENDGQSVAQAPPLDLTPPSGPANSAISGVMRGPDEQPVVNKVVELMRQVQVEKMTVTDAQGAFRFMDLPAGVYALRIEGKILADNLELDGENALEVELLYAPAKAFARYYLLSMADPALNPELARLVARWLPGQPAGVVGFEPEEAKRAAVVVMLGDGISDETASLLEAAGAQLIDHRLDLLSLAAMMADSSIGEENHA